VEEVNERTLRVRLIALFNAENLNSRVQPPPREPLGDPITLVFEVLIGRAGAKFGVRIFWDLTFWDPPKQKLGETFFLGRD
jgi:hypothetical protein